MRILIKSLINHGQNYGGGYDLQAAGILGPVVLVGQNGDETVIKDLSAHKWSYKVGLHGLTNKLFSSEKATKWSSENLPVNTTMTWYKVYQIKPSYFLSGFK